MMYVKQYEYLTHAVEMHKIFKDPSCCTSVQKVWHVTDFGSERSASDTL